MTVARDIDDDFRSQGIPMLLKADEAGRLLRCSRAQVYRYANTGGLPSTKRGANGVILFRRADVAAFLARRA